MQLNYNYFNSQMKHIFLFLTLLLSGGTSISFAQKGNTSAPVKNVEDLSKLPLDTSLLNLNTNTYDFVIERGGIGSSVGSEKFAVIETLDKMRDLLRCLSDETVTDRDKNVIYKKYVRCENATSIPVSDGVAYAFSFRTVEGIKGEVRLFKKRPNNRIGEKGIGEEKFVIYMREEDPIFGIDLSKSCGIEKYWDSSQNNYSYRTWCSRPFYESMIIDQEGEEGIVDFNGFRGYHFSKVVDLLYSFKQDMENKKTLEKSRDE